MSSRQEAIDLRSSSPPPSPSYAKNEDELDSPIPVSRPRRARRRIIIGDESSEEERNVAEGSRQQKHLPSVPSSPILMFSPPSAAPSSGASFSSTTIHRASTAPALNASPKRPLETSTHPNAGTAWKRHKGIITELDGRIGQSGRSGDQAGSIVSSLNPKQQSLRFPVIPLPPKSPHHSRPYAPARLPTVGKRKIFKVREDVSDMEIDDPKCTEAEVHPGGSGDRLSFLPDRPEATSCLTPSAPAGCSLANNGPVLPFNPDATEVDEDEGDVCPDVVENATRTQAEVEAAWTEETQQEEASLMEEIRAKSVLEKWDSTKTKAEIRRMRQADKDAVDEWCLEWLIKMAKRASPQSIRQAQSIVIGIKKSIAAASASYFPLLVTRERLVKARPFGSSLRDCFLDDYRDEEDPLFAWVTQLFDVALVVALDLSPGSAREALRIFDKSAHTVGETADLNLFMRDLTHTKASRDGWYLRTIDSRPGQETFGPYVGRSNDIKRRMGNHQKVAVNSKVARAMEGVDPLRWKCKTIAHVGSSILSDMPPPVSSLIEVIFIGALGSITHPNPIQVNLLDWNGYSRRANVDEIGDRMITETVSQSDSPASAPLRTDTALVMKAAKEIWPIINQRLSVTSFGRPITFPMPFGYHDSPAEQDFYRDHLMAYPGVSVSQLCYLWFSCLEKDTDLTLNYPPEEIKALSALLDHHRIPPSAAGDPRPKSRFLIEDRSVPYRTLYRGSSTTFSSEQADQLAILFERAVKVVDDRIDAGGWAGVRRVYEARKGRENALWNRKMSGQSI